MSHIHAVALRSLDVLKVTLVNPRAAFGSLQVDVIELVVAVFSHCLPPHIPLVMAHVKPVDVAAGVFALDVILRSDTCKRE